MERSNSRRFVPAVLPRAGRIPAHPIAKHESNGTPSASCESPSPRPPSSLQKRVSEALSWASKLERRSNATQDKSENYEFSRAILGPLLDEDLQDQRTPKLSDARDYLNHAKDANTRDELVELGRMSRRLLSHFLEFEPEQVLCVFAMVRDAFGSAADAVVGADFGERSARRVREHSCFFLFPKGIEVDPKLLECARFFVELDKNKHADRWLGPLPEGKGIDPLAYNPTVDAAPHGTKRRLDLEQETHDRPAKRRATESDASTDRVQEVALYEFAEVPPPYLSQGWWDSVNDRV